MNISVEPCGLNRKFILMNLYPLYLHDLAGIREVMPNRCGVFEEDDGIRTLQEQQGEFDIWWEKEGLLFPYLILADGLPAGFALIASGPYTESGSDYMVNEFFILRPYRGKGIGEAAAGELFRRHPGSWSLFTTPGERNRGSIAFWRKSLARHAGEDGYTEEDLELEHFGCSKLFLFSSAAEPSGGVLEGIKQAVDAAESSTWMLAESTEASVGSPAEPLRECVKPPAGSVAELPAESEEPPGKATACSTDVRKASMADLPAIAALDAKVIGHGGRLAELEKHVRSGNCLASLREGRLAGFAAHDRSFFGQRFLQLIMVDPDDRRSGVGRSLMAAWEAGFPGEKLFTSTNESNMPMQLLCEAMGYVRSGIVDNLDEGDPEIIYCRPPVA
ncbi:GNAT family N-acetyltransferase [Paenibacillus sp. D51F]